MVNLIEDEKFMRHAIEWSKRACPTESAFCVGAILVDQHGNTLSTGYSREIEGNTHAEECCILKLHDKQKEVLGKSTLYTTMEPCGERLSGKKACTDIIIENHIRRVVIGTKEPSVFISNPVGESVLRAAGVEVCFLSSFSEECMRNATNKP